MIPGARILAGLMLAWAPLPGFAAEAAESAGPSGNIVMIQAAPDVIHYNDDPEHARYSWLIGAEWQRPSHWLAGYSYFNNSFGQKSHYLYGGRWWSLSEKAPAWYFKLTGGLIVGYEEPYEDKIPLNHNGVAPALIPGVGYKAGRYNMQVNLLGKAGLIVTFGYDLIK